MVVISSALSYLILAKSNFSILEFSLLIAGGLFITFAANALNQSLEREYDKLMTRTANRPIAAGRMSLSFGVLIAGVFCTVGVLLFVMLSLPAAVLGMLSFVIYAFIYTPLKRYSTIAIPVGAIPGALPTLIAGIVATNGFTVEAICIFGLQYLWQFPHFWSIAWIGHQDYKRAGFKLINDVDGHPDPKYGLYSAVYAGLSVFLIAMFHSFSPINIVVLICLVSLVAIYAAYGWKLYKINNAVAAKKLMFASFIYLPLLLILFYFNSILQ
ncbi:MAG: protoheme IX farnesyltransferase [Saprospiraceae bacterium]|nr:protoheme IX farnesyltransferase [Saprospiraceae bacterium]